MKDLGLEVETLEEPLHVSCDALISRGPVDNPSTCEISVLGHLAPKSWY